MVEVLAEREEVKPIGTTLSICPECNLLLEAELIERGGKIYIKKTCPKHGEFTELYFGSAEMYRRFKKYAHDGKGIANQTSKNPR